MGPLDDQVVRADSLTATPDGLDIAVYSHWYRALPLPSLVKADLTVDGERIDTASLSVTVNGHRYGWAELAEQGRRVLVHHRPGGAARAGRDRRRPRAPRPAAARASRSPTSSPARTGCPWWPRVRPTRP